LNLFIFFYYYLQGWGYLYFCLELASKSKTLGWCRKV